MASSKCYIHRLLHYSSSSRKVSSFNRWELIQRPLGRHCEESERLCNTQAQIGFLRQIPLSYRLGKSEEEEDRKSVMDGMEDTKIPRPSKSP